MADIIKICPLGGLDENGRDCYVVEINDDIFVLDCGSSLPDKTIPGIDFLLPNADYLIQNKNRIQAYIITHGHDENMGALKYFYDRAPAPIYCTNATKSILRGQAAIHSIKEKFNFNLVEPSSKVYINGREVVFFQTCHNASYSFGVAIYTDKGYIVYTGDFIVDYSIKEQAFLFDMKALNHIGEDNTLVLLAESKTANVPGYCAPKHRLIPIVERYFRDANKRIFIDCFWENFFRISEIISLCKENKKKLFLYNEYTAAVIRMVQEFAPNDFVGLEILNKEDLLRVREQDVVILLLGHGEELYEELSLIAANKNADKRICLGPNDIFINCALPTPTLETLATRSIDSLYRTGCQVIWVKNKQITSMHACQDDLKFFLNVLRPKYYFPVRGNYTRLMANAKLALSMNIGLKHSNILILDNGMQAVCDATGYFKLVPNEVNGINVAPVLVDGKGISKVGDNVIDERKKMSVDGVVVVAATCSRSKKAIIAGPDCQMRGFVYVKEAEPLLKSISTIFVDEINTALRMENSDFEAVKSNIQERARRFIKRENGREPMIMPIIILDD